MKILHADKVQSIIMLFQFSISQTLLSSIGKMTVEPLNVSMKTRCAKVRLLNGEKKLRPIGTKEKELAVIPVHA